MSRPTLLRPTLRGEMADRTPHLAMAAAHAAFGILWLRNRRYTEVTPKRPAPRPASPDDSMREYPSGWRRIS